MIDEPREIAHKADDIQLCLLDVTSIGEADMDDPSLIILVMIRCEDLSVRHYQSQYCGNSTFKHIPINL